MIYYNLERELLSEETWLYNQFESDFHLQDSWEINHKHLTNKKHLSSSAWRKHLSLGKQFNNAKIYKTL